MCSSIVKFSNICVCDAFLREDLMMMISEVEDCSVHLVFSKQTPQSDLVSSGAGFDDALYTPGKASILSAQQH